MPYLLLIYTLTHKYIFINLVHYIRNYIHLGISYAPSINTYHPENYQFFAQSLVRNEISLGAKGQFSYLNFDIQSTLGYTQAERQSNRFKPSGVILATQYSLLLRRNLTRKNYYQLYELNSGCLKDSVQTDCRASFQYSYIQNRYTRNIGTQYRYNDDIFSPEIYTDYFIGWSWDFKPSITVGLETILRVKETPETFENDFNWLLGARYVF